MIVLEIIELSAAEAERYAHEIINAVGNRYFKMTCEGDAILCFSVWKSSFHNKNLYVQPYFLKDLINLKYVFSYMKNYFGSPLQCMLQSDDKRIEALKGGGFVLVRKCFEREFTKSELKCETTTNKNIVEYSPANEDYLKVCKLLYEYYSKKHTSINPLSVDFEEFAKDLPQTVYCAENGAEYGFAFVEVNEICYVGGKGNLEPFFAEVLNKIFSKYQSVFFEADDIDKAAMQLKNMFIDSRSDSFETYILE